jgi:hypothetical protein
MNRIFIILGISVAILFGSTYLIFLNQGESAQISIEEENNNRKKTFIGLKDKYLRSFSDNYPNENSIFNDYYNPEKAKYLKDTLISFFVYSSKLPMTKYDVSYYDCLASKCESEIEKTVVKKEIEVELGKIKRNYGEEAETWYQKIGEEKFLNVLSSNENCDSFFKENHKISINNSAFKEFSEFLSTVKKEKYNYRKKSEKSTSKFNSQVRRAKKTLTSSGRKMLDNQLEISNFLSDRNVDLSFNGDILGIINYSFPSKEFEEERFNTMLDDIYLEQYKNNSLRNGAKPYSYCFGSSNSCGGYGCSQIKVKTPYNSDVLVTIKKNDRVYRHAYVKASSSYTFNFSNGTYQAFFYYGKGWNPNKFMKNTSCGELKGGFISNEHFGKDYPQDLYNQILSYELILQQNGNFSTKPSNKDEAF